jgi:hypothetical protein
VWSAGGARGRRASAALVVGNGRGSGCLCIQRLGTGLLVGDPQIRELLSSFAEAAPPEAAGGSSPGDSIASFAWLRGVLDLAWTAESKTLYLLANGRSQSTRSS